MTPEDAYYIRATGGPGFGDPLARVPADVAGDVERGYVSPAAAERVYGVVFDADGGIDEAASASVREERRAARRRLPMGHEVLPLGDGSGGEPIYRDPVAGEPQVLGESLAIDASGRYRCRHCEHDFAANSTNWKWWAATAEDPVSADSIGAPILERPQHDLVFRRYCCPGCGVQVDTEVAPAGEAPRWNFRPLACPPGDGRVRRGRGRRARSPSAPRCEFLAAEAPAIPERAGFRSPEDAAEDKVRRAWRAKLYAVGYLGADWPERFGGGTREWSPVLDLIVSEEVARAGLPPLTDQTHLAAFALLRFGDPEQQERPARGSATAARPGASSSASPTRAPTWRGCAPWPSDRRGGGFRVDGQKVWCSNAAWAEFGFLIAAPGLGGRHRGIAAFIVAMSPGRHGAAADA